MHCIFCFFCACEHAWYEDIVFLTFEMSQFLTYEDYEYLQKLQRVHNRIVPIALKLILELDCLLDLGLNRYADALFFNLIRSVSCASLR